jgi:NSS family neurotransmitter:Na+ symporter
VDPFFYQTFLGLTENPGVWGDFRWPIVGALAFSWAMIFFILHKGVRRVGKVVIYTVTIPWICLIILVIRGLTLPGAVEGLNYYLTPNFSALLNGEVWFGAFSQIAFTLGLGMGIMFAYGSYIPKDSDITNNAMITSFANCATSFFAGFAVFSIIGFLAQSLGVSVQAVTESGIALTFITFPTAISMMPFIPQIIGIVLFLCIWMLGIDSAFSISEAMITGIVDKFRISKAKATAMICIISFVVGTFLFCRGSGLYWLDMIDRAVAFYGLLLAGLVECIIIGWVFGADKVREHVNSVSDLKIGKWFDWLIKIVVPVGLAYVIAWGLKSDIPVYGGYPVWASTIGVWGVLLLTLVLALIFGFVIKGKGSEEKKVKEVKRC